MAKQEVSHWMQNPVLEVSPDYDVASTLALARTLGVHHFPLLRGGNLIGMVCTCDLDDAPRAAPIREFAHPDVLTVPRSSTLTEVAGLMLARTVGAAVVMDRGHMCGLVTREDLERASPEAAALLASHHCEACGAKRHLRRSADGALLCASCAGRAHAQDWLEAGGGD